MVVAAAELIKTDVAPPPEVAVTVTMLEMTGPEGSRVAVTVTMPELTGTEVVPVVVTVTMLELTGPDVAFPPELKVTVEGAEVEELPKTDVTAPLETAVAATELITREVAVTITAEVDGNGTVTGQGFPAALFDANWN